MVQQARNLTDCEAGFLIDKKLLIMDRDPKFCGGFRSLLEQSSVRSFRLPTWSPNMNARMERFFGSLKRECLEQLVLFGKRSLRNAVREYLLHYHHERPHQGIGNQLITPRAEPIEADPPVETTERLGGLLRSYKRATQVRPLPVPQCCLLRDHRHLAVRTGMLYEF